MRLSICAIAWVAIAPAAMAMDCSKAKSPAEKAICADPAANAADDAMSAAFSRLKASLPAETSPGLLAAQRRWLRDRETNTCADMTGATLSACLKRGTEKWTATLEGRPESGTLAAQSLKPFFIEKKAKGKGFYDISIMLMKFGEPKSAAERAFNAAADASIKDAPLNESRDIFSDRPLVYTADMHLTYGSPALLSAEVTLYRDGGGAHPNSDTSHINIDGHSGEALHIDDILTPQGKAAALKSCAEQIRGEKKKRSADTISPDIKADSANRSLAAAFSDTSNWAFAAGRTWVGFNPYEIGSYAEGPYECDFDNQRLRPLLRDGFPLPD